MSALAFAIRGLAAFLCLGTATSLAAAPRAADLDNAEDSICAAEQRFAGASAARGTSGVPVGDVADLGTDDPARLAAVQKAFDKGLLRAQEQMIATFRQELDSYHEVYRQLTGTTFDTRHCGDQQRRSERRLHEQQRLQADTRMAEAEAIAASEESMLRAACNARRGAAGPSAEMAKSLPPEVVRSIMAESQASWDRLTAAYRRVHGRPFDDSRCPP